MFYLYPIEDVMKEKNMGKYMAPLRSQVRQRLSTLAWSSVPSSRSVNTVAADTGNPNTVNNDGQSFVFL